MQHLTFAPFVTETFATETIFNACRDNPERNTYNGSGMVRVTFTLLADGTHEACLRNGHGVVVALANVDEFDN